MGYKEKLKSYAEGKLEGKEKEKVESDIDRQRAIGDYFEESIDGDIFEEGKEEKTKPAGEDGGLSKLVQKAVSGKLRKFAICTGAIVLAITLFLMFGLSPLVDAMYYDPGEKIQVSIEGNNGSIKAIDLPLSVYTELHYPGKYFETAIVEDKGFAKYDISFIFSTYDSKTETRRQIMDKGEMENSFNDWRFQYMKPSFSNLFGDNGYIDDSDYVAEILNLPGTAEVTAAFSFKEDLGLAAVQNFQNEKVRLIYVPVRIWDETRSLSAFYGFAPEQPAIRDLSAFIPDKEKYPYLSVSTNLLRGKDAQETALIWETHFTSMLRFMTDQKEFNEIMGFDVYNYGNALEYARKNGVKMFGAVVCGPAAEILKMKHDNRVRSVYIMDVKLSKYSVR